jgi:CheY-like chemotaxis protein
MAKILLVEDDNNLREIYEARLMAEGYEIVSAADGESALVVAKKEKPDLIIADVMMPRISGFEMLDIIRNTEGLKQVRVIMLTALGQAEDKARADTLGADKYLVKSQVTLEDIVKAASELLGGASAAPTSQPTASSATPASDAPAAAMPVTPPPAAQPSTPAVPLPASAPAPASPPPTMPVAIAPPVAAPAPAPQAPPAQNDQQLVTNAVNNLVSSTPTTTANPLGQSSAQSTVIDDTTVPPKKKIIQPVAGGVPSTDLNELMAKEGHSFGNPDQGASPHPPAHPPGQVVSPAATDQSGQPIDPSKISL